MKRKQFPETILFLNENPLPATFTKGVISAKELRLRSALHQVKAIHVLAPKGAWVGDNENQERGDLEKKVVIHHLPSCPYYLRTLPLFLWGLYWMRVLKPDLIEAESPIISGPAGVMLSRLFRTPIVVEVRASYYELIKLKLIWIPKVIKKSLLDLVYKNTLKLATGVIANSRHYQKRLREIGIESVVINPGIQLQSIKVTRNAKHSNKTTLGFLGRLEPEKGVDILLEAIQLLLTQKKAVHNFRLLVAGNGSQRKRLEDFVRRNPGLRKRVQFIGFQNAYDFLPQIDILVNPNIVQHPLEMVNIEAAYYGKPVICFGDDQIPETVVDRITGAKVQSGEAFLLAEAIAKLLYDIELKKCMGENGKSLATHFTFASQAKRLNLLYSYLKQLD